MRTLSLILLVLGGAPGSTVRGGNADDFTTTPHHVPVTSAAPTVSYYVATADMTITSVHWVTTSVGVGLGSQTLRLNVGGVEACSVSVTCLAVMGTEVTSECNAAVLAGQDVEWTRSGCTTANHGTLTYQTRQ